jgi:hypothetical protein
LAVVPIQRRDLSVRPELEPRQIRDHGRVHANLVVCGELSVATAVIALVVDAFANNVCASTRSGEPIVRTP